MTNTTTNSNFWNTIVNVDLHDLSISLYCKASQEIKDAVDGYNSSWIQTKRTDCTCVAAELDKLETFFTEYFEEGIELVKREYPEFDGRCQVLA